MEDQPAQTPPPDQEITASVTVIGERAALLRDLAAVLGRTPEALAIEWAAGSLDPGETTEDLARDITEVLTPICARLYGRRGVKNRATRAVTAATADHAG